MTDPTAPRDAEPAAESDKADAIPRAADAIKDPQKAPPMPESVIAGFVGFGLGLLAALVIGVGRKP